MKSRLYALSLLGLCVLVLSLGACSKGPRKAVGFMDTPEHHYKLGISFVNSGDLDKGLKEFESALQLNKDYGPALAGKGLVLVLRGDADKGLDLIQDGQSEAKGKVEKIWTITAEIRAYSSLVKQGKLEAYKGVEKAEVAFQNGKLLDDKASALYFYMGELYVQALDFPKAEAMFAKVKILKAGFEEEADKLWKLVQDAIRIAPGTAVGKKIVLVDKISRGDMAALLIEELNIRRFYAKTQDAKKSEFEAPKGSVLMTGKDLYTEKGITDIAGNPQEGDIREALDLGVKGLQAYPDHTFRPQEFLSRAEVAMIFEDVIIRATGKQELATQFIGQDSPFPDVRGDHPYFNAVLLSTTKGLLQADIRTNEFQPLGTVTGVTALEAIMKLKQQLNPF